jgi:curved DNA-binding protein CbpA
MVRKIKACKTHYEVLAVQQTATENEVKKAYRKVRE